MYILYQRRFILAELLQTERTYVKDLETCIRVFLDELRTHPYVPHGIQNREATIFSNIEDIRDFHRDVFLKELEKYEQMPEDVGHCFVTWVRRKSCRGTVYFVSSILIVIFFRRRSSTCTSNTVKINPSRIRFWCSTEARFLKKCRRNTKSNILSLRI